MKQGGRENEKEISEARKPGSYLEATFTPASGKSGNRHVY